MLKFYLSFPQQVCLVVVANFQEKSEEFLGTRQPTCLEVSAIRELLSFLMLGTGMKEFLR